MPLPDESPARTPAHGAGHNGAGGLSPRTKRVLGLVAALVLGIQLAHTLTQTNNWPFSDTALFAGIMPLQQDVLRVRLYDDAGESTITDVWHVMPLDYWLIDDIMYRTYDEGDLTHLKDKLAEHILGWVNGPGWPVFDEFFVPVSRPTGRKFVALDMVFQSFDYTQYKYGTPLKPGPTRVIYSYRPEGTLPGPQPSLPASAQETSP